ncbi:MAG: hypothetical protein ISS15_15025 [Alphaproteobacteria bacterium]|nr:hypothetical protein [Alphaproteobacteria bacterium]MBL6937631.1 hypothetical protein [Alphaproteobacteria bacterium]MBL7098969.1 hypothetical protein [Alphaproteobacteria bacterium]
MSIVDSDQPSPPKPCVHLRIGVTGHRPGPKLSPQQEVAVRRSVDHIVADIAAFTQEAVAHDAWAFATTRAVLSVVSNLAEGADRIVAEAGLAQDMPLNVILPFTRADYRTDFSPEGAVQYDRLLARSQTIYELDGKRSANGDSLASNRAYEAAGLLMLANADIVIAVWDQQVAAGLGGTALIVEHAVAEGVPVVIIDPATPDRPCLLWRADTALPPARAGIEDVPRRPLAGNLERAVRILLEPSPEPGEREKLQLLYAEKPWRWNISLSYPLLLQLLGVRALKRTDLRPANYRTGSAWDWTEYLGDRAKAAGIRELITDTMLEAYSFIDHLSIAYAQTYRSAYVFNFAVSAFAVFLALSGLLLPGEAKPWLLGGEVILIALILWVIHEGNAKQWHRRWLEYRRLAETFRHLRVLALISAAARIDRPGRRSGRGQDWVSWYARAIEREIPLPNVVVNQDYLLAVRDIVCAAEIKSQIDYNHKNAHAMEEADHRMHVAGSVLFGTTFALCFGLLIFFLVDFERAEQYRYYAVFFTALFPTIGAAINAIRAQGDFNSVAVRAQETAVNLEALEHAMVHEPLEFARLADRLEKTVDVLMADNAEWHVLFRTRPLSLPA